MGTDSPHSGVIDRLRADHQVVLGRLSDFETALESVGDARFESQRATFNGLLDFARQRAPERYPTPVRPLVQSVIDLQAYSYVAGRITAAACRSSRRRSARRSGARRA